MIEGLEFLGEILNSEEVNSLAPEIAGNSELGKLLSSVLDMESVIFEIKESPSFKKYVPVSTSPTVNDILNYSGNLHSVVPAGFIMLHNDILKLLDGQDGDKRKKKKNNSNDDDDDYGDGGSTGGAVGAAILTGAAKAALAVGSLALVGSLDNAAREGIAASGAYDSAINIFNREYTEGLTDYEKAYATSGMTPQELYEYLVNLRGNIYDKEGTKYGFFGPSNSSSFGYGFAADNLNQAVKGLGYLITNLDQTGFDLLTGKIFDALGVNISGVKKGTIEETIDALKSLGIAKEDKNTIINLIREITGQGASAFSNATPGLLYSLSPEQIASWDILAGDKRQVMLDFFSTYSDYLSEDLVKGLNNAEQALGKDNRSATETLFTLANDSDMIRVLLSEMGVDITDLLQRDYAGDKSADQISGLYIANIVKILEDLDVINSSKTSSVLDTEQAQKVVDANKAFRELEENLAINSEEAESNEGIDISDTVDKVLNFGKTARKLWQFKKLIDTVSGDDSNNNNGTGGLGSPVFGVEPSEETPEDIGDQVAAAITKGSEQLKKEGLPVIIPEKTASDFGKIVGEIGAAVALGLVSQYALGNRGGAGKAAYTFATDDRALLF